MWELRAVQAKEPRKQLRAPEYCNVGNRFPYCRSQNMESWVRFRTSAFSPPSESCTVLAAAWLAPGRTAIPLQ